MICEHVEDYETCPKGKRVICCPMKQYLGEYGQYFCGTYMRIHPKAKAKLIEALNE